MQRYNSCGVQIRQLSCRNGVLHWKEVGNFGEVVDDDKDGIVLLLRQRKTCDEIHLNVIPFPLRNLKWLKQPCWPLMLCFHSPAHITPGDKTGNIPLHTSPPKALLEVLIHLGATRVDRQLRVMGLLQNDLSETSLFGNNNSLLEHHGAVIMH